ncbi:ankyrin repeat domain-containing protein [Haliovirga abyssi]|uniref:Ankyrin repeat domain-containing protein n=1 Tax=Haliovirga abyssi TaxID=2996794 RepID=A0AAU9D225_9FUSO|nr:ankyrin repeat domain-containing protein [Haliovirga abyssi]BDU50051.1 hypothetical protein HLVA_06200 [Haliovirga abyssi]
MKKIMLGVSLLIMMFISGCSSTPNYNSMLFKAIKTRNSQGVKENLSKIENVEKKNFWGDTPLTYAIKKGNVEIVKLLVEGGANVFYVDKNNKTTFYIAVESNKTDIAKYFIEKGVDVKQEDKSGKFPLIKAVKNKNVELVEAILKKGENANRKNKKLEKPITFAIKNGNEKIVELLIKYGADVNSICDKNEDYPLHLSVRKKNYKISELLINNGALVNAKNKKLENPIILAIKGEDEKIVELLINHNAVINSDDYYPLHLSVREKNYKISELLINNGALVNVKNNLGITPIEISSEKGDLKITNLLLDNKGKVTGRVLESVIFNNDGNMFKLLLEKRKLDIKNAQVFLTPFKVSLRGDESRNNSLSFLEYMFERDSDKILKVLLEKNYNLNFKEMYIKALDKNKLSIMRLLLDNRKVSINDKIDTDGFKFSIGKFKFDSAKYYSQLYYLINKPKAVKIREDSKSITYSLYDYKKRLPLIRELVRRGANVDEKISGKTLKEIATQKKMKAVVNILNSK